MSFGVKPEERSTELLIQYGVVNIDKPKGPTSHQVSDYVKRILKLDKAGHSGTLDPGVTGCLPVALGKATRIVQALLPAGKEYITVMHLHKELPEEQIRKAFEKFTGEITQLPPKKSAVKRQERQRNIYEVEIMEIDGQDVLFRMDCEAGTYVRKYVHDLGQELKVGAHMQQLRRIRAGPYDESTLVTLQDLADAYHYYKEGNDEMIRKFIQPIETAIVNLPKVVVTDEVIEKLLHGQDVYSAGIKKKDDIEVDQTVAIMSLKGEFLALGKVTKSKIEDIFIKVNKVFYQA